MVTTLLAGLALSGCSVEKAAELTILGSWTNPEDEEFRQVLKGFEKESHIKTRYEGHRDVSQVLQAGIERGRPPDVAILPRVNDLQRYVNAGQLVPLKDELTGDEAAAPQLIKLAPRAEPDGRPTAGDAAYGVAMATHLKSVVWYDPAELTKFGLQPPRTWQELVGHTQRKIGDQQVRWCLAMSSQPVSGWPGTDWIEDILLHQSGQEDYEKWTRGDLGWTSDQVKAAWTTWGELLKVSSPGTDQASLYTTFQTAAKGLFPRQTSVDGKPAESSAARGCHLDHQGSFAIREYLKQLPKLPTPTPGASPSFTFFPTPPPAGEPANSSLQEVSDDVAAMFRNTEPAQQLMKYLAGEGAQHARREQSQEVAFSRRATPPEKYHDPVTKAVAQRLRTGTLCWDGSDLLPAAIATAFERAVMVYLKARNRLDSLLTELEALRNTVPRSEWMNLRCVAAR
ncbi:ABC transporter substrate-binding protein [Micromonospora ureilytica]|uniref:ABC transporter substrate-binding protein n=1 Tax=Micromonospora ureilytica TaxID=709868 RepID=UPI002E135C38|nr:ABC transporter substrate-binding protein [Micromonospora ureilytica]